MKQENEIEVTKIINKMPNKTSSGHDGISNMLIKKLVCSIRRPLTVIFNKSFQAGIYPELFKIAKVQPLHKNRPKQLRDNYRPVSLLPVCQKY